MKLRQLKRRRHLLYSIGLTEDKPGILEFESDQYEVFRLRISKRETDDRCGEVNFLIREKSNNLRFALLYCFLESPEEISSMSFWVNTKVLLPTGELAFAGKLIDEEKATYLIMDFCERHLKGKYTFV